MTDKRPLLVIVFLALFVAGGYFLVHKGPTSTTDGTLTNASAKPSQQTNGNTSVGPNGTAQFGINDPNAIGFGNNTSTGVGANNPGGVYTLIGVDQKIDTRAPLGRVVTGENALFRQPDPARVGDYMLQSCKCYADTQAQLTRLQDAHLHVAGDNIIVNKITPLAVSNTGMRLLVSISSAGNPTVDANGKIVEPGPTGKFQSLIYFLARGQDGQWRIADRQLPEEKF